MYRGTYLFKEKIVISNRKYLRLKPYFNPRKYCDNLCQETSRCKSFKNTVDVIRTINILLHCSFFNAMQNSSNYRLADDGVSCFLMLP